MNTFEAAGDICSEMRLEGKELSGCGEAECSYHFGAYAHPCQAALTAWIGSGGVHNEAFSYE